MKLNFEKIYYSIILVVSTLSIMLGISLLIDLISWELLNVETKQELITEYARNIALDLGLDNVPDIDFYSEEPNEKDIIRKGYYSNNSKKISINTKIFKYTKNNCINTLAHEVLHYWQYNKANIGETEYAIEMRNNIIDYKDRKINSNRDYVEYRSHPIERQARAYAKRFEHRYIINRLGTILRLNIEICIVATTVTNVVKTMYKNLRGIKYENRCSNRKSTLPRAKGM